jgi:hypothetical protein
MRAPFLRQGGGFYIAGGDVQLTNCNIYSNKADDQANKAPNLSTIPAPALIQSPDGTTFLEPSESERHSSGRAASARRNGRAAAYSSTAETWCSPAAASFGIQLMMVPESTMMVASFASSMYLTPARQRCADLSAR